VNELKNKPDESWDLIIEPNRRLFDLRLRELYQYRDLIGLLVRRDFVAAYNQTVLGPFWFLIQPLMMTLMFMFVFGNIAKLGTDGIPKPLFYFSGTILWSYFSHCLTKCSNTFNSNAQLFGKIYFPRMAVPISYAVTEFITESIQFTLLLVFYFYYLLTGHSFNTNWWLLAVPLLVIQLGALGVGLGIIISSLTTKYRDLKQLLAFGMQLWMYATPIVYPLSTVPEKWLWVYKVNPVSPVIEMFRYALLGSGNFPLESWLVSVGISVAVLLLGIIIFNRNERTFIDVI